MGMTTQECHDFIVSQNPSLDPVKVKVASPRKLTTTGYG